MGASLPIYSMLSDAVFPLIERKLRKKGYEGFEERCGNYDSSKLAILQSSSPLWVHAVSVGEVQAAAPFVRAARRDGYTGNVVLSTVTSTGREMAERLIGAEMNLHIYAPWDSPRVVMRATSTFSPWAYVTMETEIWPNMLLAVKRRRVPSFLLNGRISDRTFKKARNVVVGGFMRDCYDLFTAIFVREHEDARRLAIMGVDDSKVRVIGDCKIDALLERKARLERSGEIENMVARLGEGGPIFVAGSTHEGEESIVLEAFEEVRRTVGNARLVLVPRHPERAEQIEEAASETARTSLYSRLLDGGGGGWEILVVDRIGVLFSVYPLSIGAFIGGSITPRGGQNIMEPACWGIPVQHGPHMEDFASVTSELDAVGLARQVESAGDIAEAWMSIANGRGNNAAEIAANFFESRRGAAKAAWREIFLHRRDGRSEEVSEWNSTSN